MPSTRKIPGNVSRDKEKEDFFMPMIECVTCEESGMVLCSPGDCSPVS